MFEYVFLQGMIFMMCSGFGTISQKLSKKTHHQAAALMLLTFLLRTLYYLSSDYYPEYKELLRSSYLVMAFSYFTVLLLDVIIIS